MIEDGTTTHRPQTMGMTHGASSGHPLATAAAWRILEQGGNAVDAGVAAGIALNVVLPGSTNFGGVAPILIYDARLRKVVSISGLGKWPRAATLEHFVNQRRGRIPGGVERMVVPAAADAWITALLEHGTLTFAEVVAPALDYARDGIAVSPQIHGAVAGFEKNKGRFPTRDAIFLPDGKAPGPGDRLKQPALARTFERLIKVEQQNAGKGRDHALSAVRSYFYEGPIAEEMVAYVRENGGFLSMDDLAGFSVGHEPPVAGRFHEFEVFTNGPWCQGPAFAEAIQILGQDDLRSLGHNSADYVHLVTEALKYSFSDRDAYFGDPEFVDVPIKGLMSEGFAAERRAAIDMKQATPAMPARGNPWRHEGRTQPASYAYEPPPPRDGNAEPDTSYACVVDRWGNMFSATPSDGQSAVVPGLGFTPSTRGTQTWLDPRHPSVLAPGKRPRLTPNALIAFKDGKPYMPFGTPGGDAQIQATVQFFLNIAVFGMSPQHAVEAPRFLQWSFPDSFWPHVYTPGRLELEGRFSRAVGAELARRGHKVEWLPAISGRANSVCAIAVDHRTGALRAAADIRSESYALAR